MFQTKIGFLKAVIYYGILILPIPLLIMEFKANRNLPEPILRKLISILTIIGLVYLNPLKILFNVTTWKTQTVEQINENKGSHKVELQMRDIGALGYTKRNAEVYYLTKHFYVVLSENYDDRNFIGTDWKRVNQNINEIGLK
ncbi:hypothetical protein [Winogradskyella endarachnes]|uniref:Uncharacterized protein n=1 Tax=Winogradskyella endarachnes TaxID=2681965 RepID=A0A6L6UC28_9FLAO|nr:hypothetical protein [Winogradskyella endarachnes]MUU79895.1 hypothetical protein [Winogradskyella endarachnes]